MEVAYDELSSVLLAHSANQVAACGPPEEAEWLCELVFNVTGNEGIAGAADVAVARPLKISLVFVVAYIVNRFVARSMRRLVQRLQPMPEPLEPRRRAATSLLESGWGPVPSARRAQRAKTIGALLRSVSATTVWMLACLIALSEFGLNLGPLIAGAGIVGIALGFGAQSLVRDFLAGIFMIVEDQYGVGDVIDVGEAAGTVESISLRTTRLRSVDGIVWHVPNGEIRRVGNKSQEWSRALLDVPIAYSTRVDSAIEVVQAVADRMTRDPEWNDRILERPEVWGLERFDADALALRIVVKTRPLEQWNIARELRRRLKEAFDVEGIEIPFPQRMVWIRQDSSTNALSPEDEGMGRLRG